MLKQTAIYLLPLEQTGKLEAFSHYFSITGHSDFSSDRDFEVTNRKHLLDDRV
jgi:hypothetical protein